MLLHGLSLGVNAWRSVTAGGGGGALQNDTLPAFLQPDGAGGWEAADPVDNNLDVFLDAGVWSGGTEPYSFEYAIYDASDDSVIVARGSEDELDMGSLTGLTIYGRVWCIDALANEAFADTADFGPITAGFAAAFVGRYDFRATNAYVTSPSDVFVVSGAGQGAIGSGSASGIVQYPSPGMAAIAADGTSDWADCGSGTSAGTFGDRTLSNGTTGAGARLAGRLGLTLSTAAFRVGLPNGWYRLRLVCGDPTGSFADVSLRIRDGINSGDPELFATTDPTGHSGSELVCLSESGGATIATAVAESAILGWVNGGVDDGLWSAPMQITNGAISFWRKAASGTGGCLVCLDIKTAEAP